MRVAADERNIHTNGVLCGSDIKLGRYCNVGSARAQTGAAISLRVRDLLASAHLI